MSGTLSRNQLLGRALEKYEVNVNPSQLRQYVQWGLVPEPTENRWPESAVEDLYKANKLIEKTPSLGRRVILRFIEEPTAIAPAHLKSAFLDLSRTISGAPVRKLRRVMNGLAYYHRRSLNRSTAGTAPPDNWAKPKRPEWQALIHQVDAEVLWNWAANYLLSLDELVRGFTNPKKTARKHDAPAQFGMTPALTRAPEEAQVDGIPDEERLLLLLMWFLANQATLFESREAG